MQCLHRHVLLFYMVNLLLIRPSLKQLILYKQTLTEHYPWKTWPRFTIICFLLWIITLHESGMSKSLEQGAFLGQVGFCVFYCLAKVQTKNCILSVNVSVCDICPTSHGFRDVSSELSTFSHMAPSAPSKAPLLVCVFVVFARHADC